MSLPNATVILGNGNIGRQAATNDGTALLIVTGAAVATKFALGDVLGPFKSVADAEAMGINAAYDNTNTSLAYQHIVDFYAQAGDGVELYVQVLANTVTMAQICDATSTAYIRKALQASGGTIKLIGITRIPDTVSTITDQLPADILAAITAAQALGVQEFAAPSHTPLRIMIEGHNWGGAASTSRDLRTMASNRVAVVISQDTTVAAKNAAYAKYANVGYALGTIAGLPVQRNIGRVKNGALSISTPGYSNGGKVGSISATDLNTLNTKGFIFIRQHAQYEGNFFNDDHTCVAVTDDYAYLADGRVIDKAARICRNVYVEELNDDVDVDAATGRLPLVVCKSYQAKVESAIEGQMLAQDEISGVAAYVDPAQDVNATSLIKTVVSIKKKGTSRYIETTLLFAPIN